MKLKTTIKKLLALAASEADAGNEHAARTAYAKAVVLAQKGQLDLEKLRLEAEETFVKRTAVSSGRIGEWLEVLAVAVADGVGCLTLRLGSGNARWIDVLGTREQVEMTCQIIGVLRLDFERHAPRTRRLDWLLGASWGLMREIESQGKEMRRDVGTTALALWERRTEMLEVEASKLYDKVLPAKRSRRRTVCRDAYMAGSKHGASRADSMKRREVAA